MASKLYVGNLSFRTTEDSLRAAFSSNGHAVARVSIVTDRETGRSRGFAFVEMETDEGAQSAIQAWDGKDLDGRALRVNEAREREGGGGGGFGGGGGGRGGFGGGGGRGGFGGGGFGGGGGGRGGFGGGGGRSGGGGGWGGGGGGGGGWGGGGGGRDFSGRGGRSGGGGRAFGEDDRY